MRSELGNIIDVLEQDLDRKYELGYKRGIQEGLKIALYLNSQVKEPMLKMALTGNNPDKFTPYYIDGYLTSAEDFKEKIEAEINNSKE